MADMATPSAAAMSTVGAAKTAPVTKDKPTTAAKPERPDEESYKVELGKAEKELKLSEERLVRLVSTLRIATWRTMCHLRLFNIHVQ